MNKKVNLLGKTQVIATIPVTNLNRAQNFYEDMLGLQHGGPFPNGIILNAGKGTGVALFHRGPVTNEHTVAWFLVDDFSQSVQELREKGIKFDEYDMGGMKHLGEGVYAFGGFRAAWFKDTEGNILAIGSKI